jgi:hypothetical protein
VNLDPETERLRADDKREANWKRWGPYLSERQWGTVREDYSDNQDAWGYFPFEHAHLRTYRWGEDGLLGITDRQCRLCFSIALWNGKDEILKERLYGLANDQGNHGEDVKECYFYLDATPTASYLKALYKYPQAKFPYRQLRYADQNPVPGMRGADRSQAEFELAETGVFHEDRYFDVTAEYAKAAAEDILIRITATNRGPEPADLVVLPQLWFRNTWTWHCTHEGCDLPSQIHLQDGFVLAGHQSNYEPLGDFHCYAESPERWLFTENVTNARRAFGAEDDEAFVKDAFHDYVIHSRHDAVNPANRGSKAGALYRLTLAPGESRTIRLRLVNVEDAPAAPFGAEFDEVFNKRIDECRQFYQERRPKALEPAEAAVSERAYSNLIWTKQFYHFGVKAWQDGDPRYPPPAESRRQGRNRDWGHLFNRDVISMPDKWEYPWYACWDLAFHMLPFARIDPQFAKEQLILFLREWYMHPNGQLPAYEWDFSDVNPPVHAWACWRVYKISAPRGKRDIQFLERTFQKLLLNFTWWVNRKDVNGRHLFTGGFLGLDNIGVFDRSKPLPGGWSLEQADGTAWMAFYCTTMLDIALELAEHNRVYEDVASKFFEHFLSIADAINHIGGQGLWDEEDGFYYDQLRTPQGSVKLRTASMVGLVPLFAVLVLEADVLAALPGFTKRMNWLLENRHDLAAQVAFSMGEVGTHHLLALPSLDRLKRVLWRLLDENEFLSPFGVRSFSRRHKDDPYVFHVGEDKQEVRYLPGESDSGLFGGNSNWRGPIWFPMNYLLIEALQRYHYFYGDGLKVECPTGSGRWLNLKEVAADLSDRLVNLFLPDADGRRTCHGRERSFDGKPDWNDLLLFHEYFDGDTGHGLGASHQTGWTALVAKLIEERGRRRTAGFA